MTGLSSLRRSPLVLFLWTAAAPLAAGAQEPLASGVAVEGELDVGLFGDGFVDYTIDVPADVIALEVELACSQVDLDVYVTYYDDLGDELHAGAGYGYERVLVDFVSEWPLRTGTYEVSVQYAGAPLPTWEGRKVANAPFQLKATLHRPRVEATLEAGRPRSAAIDSFERRSRTFQVEVPADAAALRFDVIDTFGDVDLFARRAAPILRRNQVTHESVHTYGRETLVIDASSRPRLRAGTWYLDVVDYGARTGRVPFTVLVTFDAAPPASLLQIPPPRDVEGLSPLERTAAAVVDLYAGDTQGSGTLLTRDGWILTNAHVVSDYADRPVEDVVVGLASDLARPPVETFRADVVEFDWSLDLALLKIREGFYGQPLPEDYRFPAARPRRDRPVLGEQVWVLGYPWIGGSGGRVSLTVTHGIVCGFEENGNGRLVKTDAGVSEGNSGGAAVDGQGRLIGVPTSFLGSGSTQISYLVPMESLPAAWRAHLGLAPAGGGRGGD